MTTIACALAVVIAIGPAPAGDPRGFAGPREVVAAETADVEPALAPETRASPPSSPPPPRIDAPEARAAIAAPVDRSDIVRDRLRSAGTASMVLAVVGYALVAVGLGVGNATTADIRSLRRPEDIDRRRTLLARGQVANHLAIGAAISAGVLTALGIALLIAGRPRDARRRSVAWRR